jgi:hypothetical protein
MSNLHNTISEETHQTARQREYEEYISMPRNASEKAAFELQCRIDQASQGNRQDSIREAFWDGAQEIAYAELQAQESRGQSEEEFQAEQLDAQAKHVKRVKQSTEIARAELLKAMEEGRI